MKGSPVRVRASASVCEPDCRGAARAQSTSGGLAATRWLHRQHGRGDITRRGHRPGGVVASPAKDRGSAAGGLRAARSRPIGGVGLRPHCSVRHPPRCRRWGARSRRSRTPCNAGPSISATWSQTSPSFSIDGSPPTRRRSTRGSPRCNSEDPSSTSTLTRSSATSTNGTRAPAHRGCTGSPARPRPRSPAG
jgi:hypothetical protein